MPIRMMLQPTMPQLASSVVKMCPTPPAKTSSPDMMTMTSSQ